MPCVAIDHGFRLILALLHRARTFVTPMAFEMKAHFSLTTTFPFACPAST